MISIMKHVQEKYVPMKKINDDDNNITEDNMARIPFGGDQLTVDRAIVVHRAFLDAEIDKEMFCGPDPKFEDWHTKLTLYKVVV